MAKVRNPLQPIIVDDTRAKFKDNEIVRDLLDFASERGMDLNTIAMGDYSQDDQEQFAQLIGYSLTGFHELSYVSDKTALKASKLARKINENYGGCRDTDCPYHTGVERE